jgi:hypothetical protein
MRTADHYGVALAALMIAALAVLAAAYQVIESRRQRKDERIRHTEQLELERERHEADLAAYQDESRAHPSVGGSTVDLEGDTFVIKIRITNTGRAIAPFLAVSLATPDGRLIANAAYADHALKASDEATYELDLPRSSVPPDTPILHPFIQWDDATGSNQRTSAHRVRLDRPSG